MSDPSIPARPALRWAVKPSFIRYVLHVASGSCEAVDGAATTDEGAFVFPLTSSSENGGTWRLTFGGGVRFLAHHGFLDVDLHGIELSLTRDATSLSIAGAQGGSVTIATAGPAAPRESGPPRWQGLVPLLTTAGAEVFGGAYAAGSELAPLETA